MKKSTQMLWKKCLKKIILIIFVKNHYRLLSREKKNRRNIPDFIVEEKIIVDLKAKRIITKEDYYQMRRYLIAYNVELGIIINFREYYINPKRILNSKNKESYS